MSKKRNGLNTFSGKLASQFFAGLAVILPIGVTAFIVIFLFDKLDSILGPIFTKYLNVSIPGLGIIALLFLIWFAGVITTNYFGSRFVHLYESILSKTPMIKTVFGALKQISDNLFTNKGNSFKQVVLVRSPFYSLYCIGFLTSEEIVKFHSGKKRQDMVHVFIPFTPPASGFIVLVPKNDVVPIDIPVEDGLKVAISIGVIHPKEYIQKAFPLRDRYKK
ncbi:MAG: DUF502 domain-containing protein [Spirochaetia bacterium]|nr:DUF502 domain-containing protein [Spirochaetia bacterium]